MNEIRGESLSRHSSSQSLRAHGIHAARLPRSLGLPLLESNIHTNCRAENLGTDYGDR